MSELLPTPYGSCRVFHPSGLLVTLPVPSGGWDYKGAFAAVGDILAAGFTANAPGLEAGEQKEMIGSVLRSEKTNDDGSLTPVAGLYNTSDAYKHSFIKLYLNQPEQIADLEAASGLKFFSLTLYDGAAMPEKGHKKIVKAGRPFGIVWGPNPRYDEKKAEDMKARNEVYKVAKKVLIRYEGQQATPTADPPKGGPTQDDADTLARLNAVDDWRDFLSDDPVLNVFNERLRKMSVLPRGCKERERVWAMVLAHATLAGWEFSKELVKFVPIFVPGNNVEEIPF